MLYKRKYALQKKVCFTKEPLEKEKK